MPCKIKNPANIDLSDLEGHVQDLYTHVHNKVGFNKPPTMVFDSEPSNEANILGKTAYYDPNTIQIHIYTDGRHPKDMLRSIAHELIHHWQNEEGRLDVGGYSGPGYYLKNKDLKGLEDEAMKLGNGYFREYEDNRKLKERNKMSLNEWRNNELNQLLMKKFGILKENADYKRDDELEEAADKNDGLEELEEDKTSYGHEDVPRGKEEELQEDSGREEEEHYDKNEMSTADHIKAIEYHLEALKKDRDYDEDHEEERQDEHRKHKDKLVGHEDRGHANARVQNLQEDEDEGYDPEQALTNPKTTTAVGPQNESLRKSVKKVLKENKKIRLRFK